MARSPNPDYDVLDHAYTLCDVVFDRVGKAGAVEVATVGVRAMHKAAQRYAPASVALKSLAWPAALKSTDADGATDTAGWPARYKQAADPRDAAYEQLKAASDAGDTAAIQAAIAALTAAAMPANEVAVKLGTKLSDTDVARKKAHTFDLQAAIEGCYGPGDPRP